MARKKIKTTPKFRDYVQYKIFQKYKTNKELAKKLGIAESTLAINLQKCSPQFVHRLREIGVVIENDNKPPLEIWEQVLELLQEQNKLLKKLIAK